MALRELSPAGLVAGRSVLGLAVLAAALPLRRSAGAGRPLPGDRLRIALLGILGLPVHLGLQAVALTLTSAVHSGWLVALIPVFTAILASTFLRERFSPLQVAGVAVGLLGAVAVIAGGSAPGVLRLPSTRGDLLILLSCLNWSVYTLLVRGLMLRSRPIPVMLGALATGTAVALVGYAAVGRPAEFLALRPGTWTALAFLGIGCTGLGYLAWAAALERIEAGALSTFQYVQPLVTAAAAALLIGEPVPASGVAGGALVLAGVFLVQRSAGKRP